jgi:hypothetical protein
MEFFSPFSSLFSVYISLFSCFLLVGFVVVLSDQTRSSSRLHYLRLAFTPSPPIHHCATSLASLKLVGFLDLFFLKLDLASSVSFPPPRVNPPRFLASQIPNATSSDQIRPPPSSASAPRACQCLPISAPQPLLLFSGFFVALFFYFLCIVVLC